VILDAAWRVARPALFTLDPERAHHLALATLGLAPSLWARLARLVVPAPAAALQRRAFGLTLSSPVGLAAGLDKDGVAIPFWPALGFGFVEVGTVTAHPQPGNPRPRLFRLPEEAALINRMGFNNRGSEALAARLTALREAGRWPAVPVGANLGKSKRTPLEEAPADYARSAARLSGLADYFVVNVSSPNTPGLRSLQEAEPLRRILGAVRGAVGGAPVLLKLAPDLADDAFAEAIELAISEGVDGIVATNTTLGRTGLRSDPRLEGGLSGRPLWPLAQARIRAALAIASGRVPVIGVGGIERADQVQALLEEGCAAVQLYTALIFRGPGLPSALNVQLAAGGSSTRGAP
jgi:dihydroorotate dehydrogenase